MKLFVVGAYSGNPDDWEWGGQTLVIAKDEKQVRELTNDNVSKVIEVCLDEAKIILTIPCYGDD